jgi:hypothetical protein
VIARMTKSTASHAGDGKQRLSQRELLGTLQKEIV